MIPGACTCMPPFTAQGVVAIDITKLYMYIVMYVCETCYCQICYMYVHRMTV